MECMTDRRRSAPAAQRNCQPILEVLARALPERARVLELASGTGVHAVAFARACPGWTWQTSDLDPEALESLRAWVDFAKLPNLLPPQELDVLDPDQAFPEADAVVAINLVHIAPEGIVESLLEKAAACLKPGALLYLYGPYRVQGGYTSEGNRHFNQSLRQMHPEYGLRSLEEVKESAKVRGFRFQERVNMPANNFSLLFTRLSPQETLA